MAVFRCKMCGGDLLMTEGSSTCVCEFCGTEQTIPTVKDENLQGLFNRANVLRMKAEFDKAEEIYEKILRADESEAEAYWGLVLCKYGVVYAEDPVTFKRIPACHRTSYEAVTADEDYKNALKYADIAQRGIYEAEAKTIDDIRKGILAISQKEAPYDVFICYNETDENGKRTQDSAIANDIYYQLTQEGFKVFCTAITLEDKFGSECEPYIFSALNTAKVMLCLGTKPEYFSAVWVKNEWSRFLKLIKKDRSKLLIPCYRDMDTYELPEEFAHLQTQDMSRISFIIDLIRDIRKVVSKEEKSSAIKETVVEHGNGPNLASLLKRAFMFLEDGDWKRADDFCEQVLNNDPENAQAYVGKLMAQLKVNKQEDLADCEELFDDNDSYRKAMRFASPELKKELEGYVESIKVRIETNRLDAVYDKAQRKYEAAGTEKQYKEAASIFQSISEWKDSRKKAAAALEKAEEARKQLAAKAARKKKRRLGIAVILTVLTATAVFAVMKLVIIPNNSYKKAAVLENNGEYAKAAIAYGKLKGYSDAKEKSDMMWKQVPGLETIEADFEHVVGLKSDGTVVAEGSMGNGKCNVSDWTDIVAVSAGFDCTVGLKSDGTVIAVGDNENGQCDVSDWTDIVAVSAGGDYIVGLKSDGTVVSTGGRVELIDSDGTVVSTSYYMEDKFDWSDIRLPN